MGLLDRIFRRDFSLRVEEGRVCGCAVIDELMLLLLLLAGAAGEDVELVVEVVVDVEEVGGWREGEGCGVVTSQMIVLKIEGAGGSEEPALNDIAICIKGR